MCNLIAAICFLLALFGHDGRIDDATAQRPTAGSGMALHSKTHIIPGLIDRECETRAISHCYYVLFPGDCVADAPGKHSGWRIKPASTRALD